MTQQTDDIFDIIIVGQGLAGSLLAWELAGRGRHVLVVDDASPNAASRVAAGLVNPVTGPRLALTPGADRLFGTMRRTISGIEARFGTPLFHPLPLIRRFDSERMLDFWHRRIEDPNYASYLDPQTLSPSAIAPIEAPLGGFRQYQTGWLDCGGLIRLLGDWLQIGRSLRRSSINHDRISVGAGYVGIGGLRAGTLVFCEGYRLADNPWFDWLPLQPAKGEILTLQAEYDLPQRISSAGRWLVPLGRKRFRFGATYGWHRIDDKPTNDGKGILRMDLTECFPSLADAMLIDHRAGVRPATRDRHPFLGRHPSHPRLTVFNGFGSKGSLMIPWYAKRFADFLIDDEPLPEQADIARFRRS